MFSGSLPATRLAVLQIDPLFLTFARAGNAGLLALLLLVFLKQKRPARRDVGPLLVVALTVVIGFPLFSALALRSITAAHAIVFIGLLPLSTATFGVWRGGERPHASFWIFALLGAGLVVGYAVTRGGAAGSLAGDIFMGLAVLVCGLGYAEGARLSRHLGGWQTISWALVYALPVMVPLACWSAPESWSSVGWPALAGLAYVSLFSMLIGFIFWYRGLALGGIAAVGQLQLLQPFFGLVLAAGVLHEAVGRDLLAVSLGVVVCVAAAKRTAGGTPIRSTKQHATLATTR